MLRTPKPVLLKMLSSSLCLWSLSHMTTHKPGFPCKSRRIAFKVTQRDDQYDCVVLLPTISQHGSCKFITSYSQEKEVTYLKLTLYSLALSVRKKGNLGVGNCRAHLPCICVMQSQTCNWHNFFMCTPCDVRMPPKEMNHF